MISRPLMFLFIALLLSGQFSLQLHALEHGLAAEEDVICSLCLATAHDLALPFVCNYTLLSNCPILAESVVDHYSPISDSYYFIRAPPIKSSD